MAVSRLSYSQFLLVSQVNYTLTYYADHMESLSHDAVTRYLAREDLTPSLLWEQVQDDLVPSPNGYILFDDTVLDKNHSHKIEGVRKQYSGNAGGIIKGIGVVTCVYVNPELDRWWAVDYRIYDPDADGKKKPDHVEDMLDQLEQRKLQYRTVLMDSWYATKRLILGIEERGKIYYCPLKSNRLVDDSGGAWPYHPVSELQWSEEELTQGKTIKIQKFPENHKVKLFRVTVSTHRTDFVITNDEACDTTDDAQKACAIRWKIEQFHRELKQTTGIEKCQCRKRRSQRNHIACAMIVWARLKQIAYQTQQTVYQIKQNLLDNYIIQQLKKPHINIISA